MSDSLSSADRDARIAAAEASLNRADPSYAANFVPWLIAELRAALSREAATKADYQVLLEAATRDAMELGEAKKDAERWRYLAPKMNVADTYYGSGKMLHINIPILGMPIVNDIEHIVDDAITLRDYQSAVSLSENG